MYNKPILLVFGLTTLAYGFPAAFDNVNVDALLAKPEVVDAYVGCLLENSACNESGLRLKAITPNALLEKCSKCTPYQRDSVQKISKTISTKKPAEWAKILEKYDPKSEHRSDIEALLNAKPAEPLEKPAEPAKPEDAPKPAEPAKPEDQPKAENSPKSAAKLEEPAKLAEPLKPEPAKLEEPAKPELEKPAEPAKPADLAKKPDTPSS